MTRPVNINDEILTMYVDGQLKEATSNVVEEYLRMNPESAAWVRKHIDINNIPRRLGRAVVVTRMCHNIADGDSTMLS